MTRGTTGVLLSPGDGGTKFVALSMYGKGSTFIKAAVLLNQHAKDKGIKSDDIEYVVLHLIGQGIECTLKGLLLFKDYDRYVDKLKTRGFGHNLYNIAEEALKAYGTNGNLKSMRPALAGEIRTLSGFYSRHRLRYGTVGDMFTDPYAISHEKVFRRFVATIRLAERELRRAQIR